MTRMGLLSIALATAVTVACNGNTRSDSNAVNTPNDQTTAVGTAGEAANRVLSGARCADANRAAAGAARRRLGRS